MVAQHSFTNDDDSWVNEPNFKARFELANRWISKFIVDHPTSVGDDGFVMNMNFKCEIEWLGDEQSIDGIFRAIRKIKEMGWVNLLNQGYDHCHELAAMPGYFSVRLSEGSKAVVAKHGSAMIFMTLYSEQLKSLLEERDKQFAELRAAARLRDLDADAVAAKART